MNQQKKRVLLNKSRSSLGLDYQSMPNENSNEYTRQLVANALSTSAETTIMKHIEIPTSLLKKSSLRTSASAPCSPSKSVSFNQIEDVRFFKKAQTPLAISQKDIFWANSSSSDSDSDDPCYSLTFPNWPEKDMFQKEWIKIDRNHIELVDGDVIYGKVCVKNTGYQKSVTLRYTWDFWESFENSQARFCKSHKNYDVFEFKIPTLSHQHHLYFAIHYQVGNQEHWDNNNGRNYELVRVATNKELEKKEDVLKSRYDFSQAILQQPSPPLLVAPIPIAASNTISRRSSPIISCSGNNSPVESNSQSYMELVNKYCFYSTSPSRSPIY